MQRSLILGRLYSVSIYSVAKNLAATVFKDVSRLTVQRHADRRNSFGRKDGAFGPASWDLSSCAPR